MSATGRLVFAVLLCLLSGSELHAETFTGRRVLDGDTVEVLVDRTPQRVRLAGIDAPEKAQAFGTRAKQKLGDLVGGQQVQVDWHKTDKYGRAVGKLIAQGKDMNLAMVSAGLAWWYRKYADEQSPVDRAIYESAEAQAKTARRGLWADPAPTPPWTWRHAPTSPESYPAACPCGSAPLCTGPRGGHFCIAPDGKRRYQHVDEVRPDR